MPGLKVPIIIPCVDCGKIVKRKTPLERAPQCYACRNAPRTRISFCEACKVLLPAPKRGGRYRWCYACRPEKELERCTRNSNRFQDRQKAKMLANPEFREAVLAKRREWAANTQQKKDTDPAFRRRVQDRTNRWIREHRVSDPVFREKIKSKDHERRARGKVLPGVKALLMEKQRGRCANPFCKAKLDEEAQLDHIVAVKRGGTNATSNLQLLCSFCNQSKKDKPYGDFLERERLKRERSTA